MPIRYGRFEKRTRLAVPVQISSLQDPFTTERTTTENISSVGVRVFVQQPREPNGRLLIKSLDGQLQTHARVVYCQRLSDGRYGIGLEFQAKAINWPTGSLAGTAD